MSDNIDTIKNISVVASYESDTIGKVITTNLDIVNKAREITHKQPITDNAVIQVVNPNDITNGTKFCYVLIFFWIIWFHKYNYF